MMIKVLDKNVADKIAAGEVIERPVSIVKELLENAVDSGAGSIICEIKKGGKTYIRVTDDGCGIAKSQVKTAFLRHATSKIEEAKDLESIETLGFRGEALASIAAVTRTEIVTKTAEEKVGTKLILHGSDVLDEIPTGCPDGTTIIVSDLFYNTPARKKFLKGDSQEASKIIKLVSEIAIAYPNCKFRLINNDNILFSTRGDGDLKACVMSVFRQQEYETLVDVDYEDEYKNRVYGLISKPSQTRTNRSGQIFYVNGRVIESKTIEKGLVQGYKERLFDGRFPIAILFLSISPDSLDVNIHPNKREVRFNDEQQIADMVKEAVIQTLGTKKAVTEASDIFSISKEETLPETRNNPEKNTAEEQVDIKNILSIKRPAPFIQEKKIEDIKDDTDDAKDKQRSKIALEIREPMLKPFDFSTLTVTGCIFRTYITAVDEDSFYLIDQHAAHERIFYEKLVSAYMNEDKLSQPILTPITIDVPLDVCEQAQDWLDSLTEMGFSMENFGPNSYIVREIPTFMEISEAENFLKSFIDGISDDRKSVNQIVIDKLITKSCKSAVKAHDTLSMEEMKALIEQLQRCRNPFSCPHGRPTFIKMSQYQLERMFKRV